MLKHVALSALVATTVGAAAVDNNADRFNFRRANRRKLEVIESDTAYTVYSDTYYSDPMTLAPGEMVFTSTSRTPMAMPDPGNTGYAIVGFGGEIVDENMNSAPLSECYDHHWIAVQATHQNQLCTNTEYVVGIGAESRHTKSKYPEGYGYVVNPGENAWGANIHLLHTVGLSGEEYQNAKECNECWYAENKAPDCVPAANGTFECCGQDCPTDTCYCPTDPALTSAEDLTMTYYLKYQVNYTYDLDLITPLDVGVLTAPDCATFYAVYENNEEPESLASTSWTAPATVEVVYAVGHQHVGALNISLFVNDEFLCASYPRYGEVEGEAGNEQGYLVEMSTCLHKDKTGSKFLKKGDELRVDSWYYVGSNDERIAPHPGGTHLNVMGYMYFGYVLDEASMTTTTAAPKCDWWNC